MVKDHLLVLKKKRKINYNQAKVEKIEMHMYKEIKKK